MDKKAIIEALRDKPQLGRPDIKGIPRRVTDAVNRNIATLLGTPVDTVTNAINLGIAGVGTLGHKLGLVSTPPNVIENPIGGSEWFGQQMEQRGMVSPERNTYNEVMAGLLMPAATTRAAKTLFNAEQQAARNIAAPDTLNTPRFRGQRGAVGIPPEADDFSYRGRHTAPNSEFGAPLHDLTGGGQMYPADVYSARAAQIYGTGFPQADKEAFALALRVKGKPEAMVKIYRAVPNDPNIKMINQGDWVTLSKEYAKGHGESVLQNQYKIIEKNVKAKDLWTNADSIHEFGYWPTE